MRSSGASGGARRGGGGGGSGGGMAGRNSSAAREWAQKKKEKEERARRLRAARKRIEEKKRQEEERERVEGDGSGYLGDGAGKRGGWREEEPERQDHHHLQSRERQQRRSGGSGGGGGGGGSGGAFPKHSAAQSHVQNREYMEEFDHAMRMIHGDEWTREDEDPDRISSKRGAGGGVVGPSEPADPHVAASNRGGEGSSDHAGMLVDWGEAPRDPEGLLVDVCDRPVLCAAVLQQGSDGGGGSSSSARRRARARDAGTSGMELVVGSSDHALYTFDMDTGRPLRQLYNKRCGHTEWVTSVVVSSNNQVISGGMDGKLCLWRGQTCHDMRGHTGSVSKLLADRTQPFALSASYDHTIRGWDTTRGREIMVLDDHEAPIIDVAYAGNHVVSGARDGSVFFWDMSRGECLRKNRGHKGHTTAVAVYQEEGPDRGPGPGPGSGQGQEQGQGGEDAGMCPIFLTGGQDGLLKVWDLRESRSVMRIPCHQVPGEGSGAIGDILLAGRSVGGGSASVPSTVVTYGADKTVSVMDVRAGGDCAELHRFDHHRDFIYSARIVAETFLFSGGGDGLMLCHDLRSGELKYGLGANQAAVRGIVQAGSRLAATGDDGNILIWSFAQ